MNGKVKKLEDLKELIGQDGVASLVLIAYEDGDITRSTAFVDGNSRAILKMILNHLKKL